MLARMTDRGGDQRATRNDAGLCIGVDVRWTTPGAQQDLQPLVMTEPPFWLAMDGRLDNRDDIAARLGASAASSDADLCARWLVRRPADLAALVGDFSLATWDPRARHLRLVRDGLGARSLYYAETPDALWFASSLAAMLVPEWYTPEPNEGFIAEYLAEGPASVDETPFMGIRRLPQGHVLDVTSGATHSGAYWAMDLREERRVTDADAVEEFQSIFTAAVKARLRSRAPVAFQLSGGLDSSTVVGVAHALGHTAPATYSRVYPEVPEADESPYIDAVVARTSARSVRMPVYRFPVQGLDVFAGAVHTADLADFPTGQWLQRPLLQRARADGHDAILTGSGGDDWLSGSLFRVPALVRQGRLRAAWRYAREYRSLEWWDPGARTILRVTGASLLPAPVRSLLRALGAGPAPRTWITRGLASRVDLPERLRAGYNRVPGTRDLVMRESLIRLSSGEGAFVRDAMDRMGHASNIELRHPFFDRRVVEFVVGLPDHLRLRHGIHKYLLRQAFGHVLPEQVRTRGDKPHIEHLVADSLRAIDPPSWFGSLEVEARGWVPAGAVRDLWERQDPAFHPALWNIFAVEAWLRAIFSTPDHVPAARRTSPVPV
jgi:asparagine synthase (glutamine-hydrolysing)